MAKFIPWDDIIIDILPPYDHIKLMYLNTTALRCPRCHSVYTRSDYGDFDPHKDIIVCHKCAYQATFSGWHVKVTLGN